jgi:hypothetical protein
MTRWMAVRGRLVAAVLLAACAGDANGPRPEPLVPVTRAEDARPLRILFIGNSLTFYNDLPMRTAEIAEADTTLRWPDAQSVTRSSTSLRQHWFIGTAPQRIQAERWDYVVLQEGSLDIVEEPETTEVYVAKYDSLARAAGARTMLYLTWTYGDIPQLQDSVTHVYTRIADHVGILVAPVGVAWQRALQLHPTLPLYLPDSIHPAPVGTYLAANTMFAALYRRTPVGLAGLVAIGDTSAVTLDSATAVMLQQTSWTVTQPYLPTRP